MLIASSNIKVYLALGTTDMRKSINGLSVLVSELLDLDLFSGNLFVFCNKKQNMLKIFYWDRNGFCLWHKRLEKDRFNWPKSKQEVITIERRELEWLLNGLSISQQEAHIPINYSTIF